MKSLISLIASALILLVVLLPHDINGECCYSTTLKFNMVNEGDCRDFGGSMPYSGATTVGGAISNQLGNIINRECQTKVCGDGHRTVGTYCGQGSCNIAGCNCDFGCIPGDAKENFKRIHGDGVNNVRNTIWHSITSG